MRPSLLLLCHRSFHQDHHPSSHSNAPILLSSLPSRIISSPTAFQLQATLYPDFCASNSSDQYKSKAASYDSYRHPRCGWDTVVKNMLGVQGKKLLDFGCGTGSFFDKLNSRSPSKIDAFDPCQEMVDFAKERTVAKGGNIPFNVWCGFSDKVPTNQYDYVTCFQVLQNISDDCSKAADARLKCLMEIKRILKPGGKAIITTRFRPPVSEGGRYSDMYWYADPEIVPKSVNFMEDMVPADPVAEAFQAGFTSVELKNSKDTVIRSNAYLHGELVNNEAFRSGDSFFARVSQMGELSAMTENIKRLQAKGELENYIQKRNQLRGSYGHIAVLVVS